MSRWVSAHLSSLQNPDSTHSQSPKLRNQYLFSQFIEITFLNWKKMTYLAPSLHSELSMSILKHNVKRAINRASLIYLEKLNLTNEKIWIAFWYFYSKNNRYPVWPFDIVQQADTIDTLLFVFRTFCTFQIGIFKSIITLLTDPLCSFSPINYIELVSWFASYQNALVILFGHIKVWIQNLPLVYVTSGFWSGSCRCSSIHSDSSCCGRFYSRRNKRFFCEGLTGISAIYLNYINVLVRNDHFKLHNRWLTPCDLRPSSSLVTWEWISLLFPSFYWLASLLIDQNEN